WQSRKRVVQRLVFESGLRALLLGDVAVDPEHRRRLAVRVSLQRPAAGDGCGCSIAPRVDQLTLPTTGAHDVRVDFRQRAWKSRVQDGGRSASQHLLFGPPVKLLGAAIPEADR